jgi:hypothetical protein
LGEVFDMDVLRARGGGRHGFPSERTNSWQPAKRFVQIVAGVPKTKDAPDAPDVTVDLDSPGGNLFEGIRLGLAIRAASIPTLLECPRSVIWLAAALDHAYLTAPLWRLD